MKRPKQAKLPGSCAKKAFLTGAAQAFGVSADAAETFRLLRRRF